MEFKTQYTRTPSVKEPGGGKVITERAGYIPNKIRIENMMLAGQRLVDYRKEKYDWEDGQEIDETYDDPTRKRNLDMAEATQMQYEAEMAIKQARKDTQDARKRAQDESEAIKNTEAKEIDGKA